MFRNCLSFFLFTSLTRLCILLKLVNAVFRLHQATAESITVTSYILKWIIQV